MDVTDNLVQTLRTAILASQRPQLQAETHAWLNEFRQTKAMWEVAWQLYGIERDPMIRVACVILLQRKARSDWGLLDMSEKESLRQKISAMLENAVATEEPSLLMRQILILYIVTIECSDSAKHCLDLCFRLGRTHPTISLQLLQGLPQEAKENMDKKDPSMICYLNEYKERIMESLDESVKALTASNCSWQHNQSTCDLCCAYQSWIELPGSITGETTGYTVESMLEMHPETFVFLLSLCTNVDRFDGSSSQAGLDVLVALLKGTYPEEGTSSTAHALNTICDAIVQTRGTINTHSGGERARLIAELGSSLADCWPEGIAGMLQHAESLAELMLLLLQHHDSTVTEASSEYFFAFNLVDTDQRTENLQQSMHMKTVEALFGRVQYPNQMNDSGDLPQGNDISRVREVVASELLQESYSSIAQWYLDYVASGLQQKEWTCWEASMFLISSSALQIRTKALAIKIDGTSKAINELLVQIFDALYQRWKDATMQLSPIQLALFGLQVGKSIQQFSVWFGKKDYGHLREMICILLDILTLEIWEADKAAASAFKEVCSRTSPKFKDDRDSVQSLVSSVLPIINNSKSAPVGLDLIEGLTYLASSLHSPDCEEIVLQTIQQPVQAIEIKIQNNSTVMDLECMEYISHCLNLIARALKALLPLSMSHSTKGPDLTVGIFNYIGPLLSSLASFEIIKQNNDVTLSILTICKQSVTSGGKRGIPILPDICRIVTSIFYASLDPYALEVTCEIIEMHFEDECITENIMGQCISALECAFRAVERQGIDAVESKLVASLMNTGYTLLVYYPQITKQHELLHNFIALSALAVVSKEPETASKALQLIEYIPLLSNGGDSSTDTETVPRFNNFFIQESYQIIEALFYALCEVFQRQHVLNVANTLASMFTQEQYLTAQQQWLQHLSQSNRLKHSVLKRVPESIFYNILNTIPSLSTKPKRLARLLFDFALVTRQEDSIERLSIYCL